MSKSIVVGSNWRTFCGTVPCRTFELSCHGSLNLIFLEIVDMSCAVPIDSSAPNQLQFEKATPAVGHETSCISG